MVVDPVPYRPRCSSVLPLHPPWCSRCFLLGAPVASSSAPPLLPPRRSRCFLLGTPVASSSVVVVASSSVVVVGPVPPGSRCFLLGAPVVSARNFPWLFLGLGALNLRSRPRSTFLYGCCIAPSRCSARNFLPRCFFRGLGFPFTSSGPRCSARNFLPRCFFLGLGFLFTSSGPRCFPGSLLVVGC